MDSELAEKERKVLDTAVSEFSYPLPPSLQKDLKDFTLEELGINRDALDGDPDNQGVYLDKLGQWAKGATLWMKYKLPTSANNAQPARTKRGPYIKTYERRYHLVEFIVDKWACDNGSRIDWERVTTEWNEAHPYDRFVKPISLKSLFNKAMREPGVIAPVLFRQVAQGMIAFLDRGQTPEVFRNYAGKVNQFLSELGALEVSNREHHPLYYLFDVLLKYLTFTEKLEANRRRNKIVRTLIYRNIPAKYFITADLKERVLRRKREAQNER